MSAYEWPEEGFVRIGSGWMGAGSLAADRRRSRGALAPEKRTAGVVVNCAAAGQLDLTRIQLREVLVSLRERGQVFDIVNLLENLDQRPSPNRRSHNLGAVIIGGLRFQVKLRGVSKTAGAVRVAHRRLSTNDTKSTNGNVSGGAPSLPLSSRP
jgi:hypothetical protein